MKRYRLFLPIFLFLCFACTQFDEEVIPEEAPTTRAAVNAAALRESAGIANTDNPYSVDNMKAAMTQYCKVMNIQPRPYRSAHLQHPALRTTVPAQRTPLGIRHTGIGSIL